MRLLGAAMPWLILEQMLGREKKKRQACKWLKTRENTSQVFDTQVRRASTTLILMFLA